MPTRDYVMSNESKYIICKTLDERPKLLWLPIEEILPALVIGGAMFFMGSALLGLVFGFAWFVLIRKAKKGQGAVWLYSKIYWYAPTFVTSQFLKKTPSSEKRHWIG